LKAIADEASAAEEIDEVFHPLILIDQGANYCRLFVHHLSYVRGCNQCVTRALAVEFDRMEAEGARLLEGDVAAHIDAGYRPLYFFAVALSRQSAQLCVSFH
jgi:hypothetical protein